MHEPDFWSHCSDATELSIEGNRLIAREVAELIRDLWRRTVRKFDGFMGELNRQDHLPPV